MAARDLAAIAMEEQHGGLARLGRRIPQHNGFAIGCRHALLGDTGKAEGLRRCSRAGREILEAALLQIHEGNNAEIENDDDEKHAAQQGHHAYFSRAGVAVSRVQHHTASSGVALVMVACSAMDGCQTVSPGAFSTKGLPSRLQKLSEVSGQ